MKRVLVCDFADSFTYNIYSCFKEFFPEVVVDVISFEKIDLKLALDYDLVVLGPGPGHPREYQKFLENINLRELRKTCFIFGVCLGHQLFWSVNGAEIKPSINPVHGQKVQYNLEGSSWARILATQSLEVQRYNSLGVYKTSQLNSDLAEHIYWCQNELIMSWGDNFLTYQFHPESVGTTYPESLFRPLAAKLL